MKKILSMLIIISLLMSSFTTVFAADGEITVNVRQNSANAIVISGSIEHSRGNIPLVITISDASGCIAIEETQSSSVNNGISTYQTDGFMLAKTAPSGEYKIEVNARYINKAASESYDYIGCDSKELLMAIQTVQECLKRKDFNGILSCVEENPVIAPDFTHSELGTKGKKAFSNTMLTLELNTPDNNTTVQEQEQLYDQLAAFREMCTKADMIGSFYDIKNKENYTVWYERFGEFLTLSEKDAEYSYYQNSVNNEAFTTAFISETQDGITDIPLICDRIYECALLTTIKVKGVAAIRKMFEGFPEYFEINKTNASELSSTKLDSAYAEIAGKAYKSCEEAAGALDKAISKLLNSSSSSTSNSSSGSSGSWGPSSNSSFSVGSTSTSVTQPSKLPFTDLENYQWAAEAIRSLYERQIVAGREDNRFAPGETVTRAEFVKMLVLAFGVEVGENIADFTDVAANAWYSKYIAAAQMHGIAAGDENGEFHPNDSITRQDMAVLIYRIMNQPTAENELSFSDADNISNYAMPAVCYLSGKGIISGMGDNKFVPLGTATRAQAAQMLYKAGN